MVSWIWSSTLTACVVVEDEGSIALLIEDMLLELGCEIAASAAHLAQAREVACSAGFDFAVLDVNLAGQPAFPVAKILRERRIPFVFSTGYGASGIPEEFKGTPTLSKPFAVDELREKIAFALGR
jgi:CheY-like chemotaxis protein